MSWWGFFRGCGLSLKPWKSASSTGRWTVAGRVRPWMDAGPVAGGHPDSAFYQSVTLSRWLKPPEPLCTIGEYVALQ